MSKFTGFSRELPDFWFDLHFNNNVENEAVMKEKYKIHITAPLMDLSETLAPTVLALSETVETAPARCVSSPYTDRRFSRGTPFKEYMYLRFKQGGKREDVPGLYFDMGAEYYSYGLRVYKQTARGMQILRERLCGYTETVSAILDKAAENGFVIIGEDYKIDHFPDIAACSAKTLLNKKSFYIGKEVGVNPSVFTAALAEEIADGFRAMGEIFAILCEEP